MYKNNTQRKKGKRNSQFLLLELRSLLSGRYSIIEHLLGRYRTPQHDFTLCRLLSSPYRVDIRYRSLHSASFTNFLLRCKLSSPYRADIVTIGHLLLCVFLQFPPSLDLRDGICRNKQPPYLLFAPNSSFVPKKKPEK